MPEHMTLEAKYY